MEIKIHSLPDSVFSTDFDLGYLTKNLVSIEEGISVVVFRTISLEKWKLLSLLVQSYDIEPVLLKTAFIYDINLTKQEVLNNSNKIYFCQCSAETSSISAASRLASVFEDVKLIIWTTSNHLRTVDSKYVPTSSTISCLSYSEAKEYLTFINKKKIYQYLKVAMDKGILISLCSLKDMGAPGTLIAPSKALEPYNGVKCLCVIDKITYVSVDHADVRLCHRVLGAMEEAQIDVYLAYQAIGDNSFTISVRDEQATECRMAIEGLFTKKDAPLRVRSQSGISIIGALSEGMAKSSGMSGSFFAAIGGANIIIKAFSQGAYESSIRAAISSEDVPKALRALNRVFFEGQTELPQIAQVKPKQELFMGLYGIGNVGSCLLRRIKEFNEASCEFKIVLCMIANSKRCLIDMGGINLEDYQNRFDKEARNLEHDVILDSFASLNQQYPTVIVDCTDSVEVPNLYVEFFKAGINIVTANKISLCLESRANEAMFNMRKSHSCFFGFEACVGSGLPVVRMIKDLVISGEQIVKIEATLNGTLSWLLNSYNGSESFSSLVLKAISLGYAEPDPRIDLEGIDSARKTLILCRMLGQKIDLNQINVQPVIEVEETKDLEVYLKELSHRDEIIEAIYQEAKKRNKILRYVSTISDTEASCCLRLLDSNNILTKSEGAECSIIIYTKHYPKGILLRGDAAGAEVTVNALMADLCQIIKIGD